MKRAKARLQASLPLGIGEAADLPGRNGKPEAAALVEVLQTLRTHPAVAWCERMNSGAAHLGGRFIRFGFKGCPDVLGLLRDGRFLACEVKAAAGRLRPEQAVFLALVQQHGGISFVARNALDVLAALRVATDDEVTHD